MRSRPAARLERRAGPSSTSHGPMRDPRVGRGAARHRRQAPCRRRPGCRRQQAWVGHCTWHREGRCRAPPVTGGTTAARGATSSARPPASRLTARLYAGCGKGTGCARPRPRFGAWVVMPALGGQEPSRVIRMALHSRVAEGPGRVRSRLAFAMSRFRRKDEPPPPAPAVIASRLACAMGPMCALTLGGQEPSRVIRMALHSRGAEGPARVRSRLVFTKSRFRREDEPDYGPATRARA